MKAKDLKLMLIIITFPLFSIAQQWDWAIQTNDSTNEPWLELSHIDKHNNIYLQGTYSDYIEIYDTSFSHENVYGYFKTLAKFSPNGQFLTAFDFYSLPDQSIHQLNAATDSDESLYVLGDFVDRIFIQDTILVHGPTPSIGSPELFLAKYDKNNSVIWADVISGSFQDDLIGIESTEDGQLIVGTYHMTNAYIPIDVYFFDQDSCHKTGSFLNFMKIDKDKNILWRKEISVNSGRKGFQIIDDKIYYWGATSGNIRYNGDTIINPNNYTDQYFTNFRLTIDTDGNVEDISFVDIGFSFSWASFLDDGDLIMSMYLTDTNFIQNDTVIIPPNNEYYMLGKVNQNSDFDWYKILKKNEYNVDFAYPQLKCSGDKIFYCIAANRDFIYDDTLITSQTNRKIFLGEINGDGTLKKYSTATGSSDPFRSNSLIIDNCSDPIIAGSYVVKAIFSEDTLRNSYANPGYFISKLNNHQPVENFLGNDTIACESLLIESPPDYSYYLWNDSLTSSNIFQINESNEVTLAMGDENNCWHYDTIQVQIDEGFELSLNSDTTIFGNDTIFLSVEEDLEKYLWSNGDTTSQIQVIGNNFGIGEFPIWVEAKKGSCIDSDTLLLIVEEGFGIGQQDNSNFSIYPNPTNNYLVNVSNLDQKDIYFYEIINLAGVVSKKGNIESQKQIISVKDLNSGIYMFNIINSKMQIVLSKKLIIQH